MSSIEKFLSASTFAVAGASTNRGKFGNRVFRALLDSGRTVWPLNPAETEVEGHRAWPDIRALPSVPESLSIVTPPWVTSSVIDDAIEAGVKNIWMQPGAEHPDASTRARSAGINVIDDGSCILIALRH